MSRYKLNKKKNAMYEKINNNNLVVLLEQVGDYPKGLMFIADDVDYIDGVVEFEIEKYFKSVPISKVRIATTKEKYHYDFWVKNGRHDILMNVNSIV